MEADAAGEAERVGVGVGSSDGDTDTDGGRRLPGRPVRAGSWAGTIANERTKRTRLGRLADSAKWATHCSG
jgi:hypothetical protein